VRSVSRRFRTLIGGVNRWTSTVEWSNDGGQTWTEATFVGGTVTADSTQQTRWSCSVTMEDVPVGKSGVNAFTTQLRVRHGIAGEQLLDMGRYKVTKVARSTANRLQTVLTGASHEVYVQGARFTSARTFYPQQASDLVRTLITEVIPSASISWLADDLTLPLITEPRDRWPLLDGDRDATSIARSLGARLYCGPSGEWIVKPVPALTDAAVWSASLSDVLIESGQELSDDGVYNIMVVSGQSGDSSVPVFAPGIAQDKDPLSLTYVDKPVDQGGFGPRPRFYTSQLITSNGQAQTAAQGMLAPLLGLKEQITFTQLHDPTLEPGDVGLVETVDGPRHAILDACTYALDGSPLQTQTRTTETRLAGDVTEAPTQAGGEE
jgi:hypothetical protein